MTHHNESAPPLLVKLCTDKATFEVRTKQGLHLNMNEVKRTLEESEEHKIVVYTPHIIILKTGRAETTLCRDGRMLIKRVANETEASQVASKILQAILK